MTIDHIIFDLRTQGLHGEKYMNADSLTDKSAPAFQWVIPMRGINSIYVPVSVYQRISKYFENMWKGLPPASSPAYKNILRECMDALPDCIVVNSNWERSILASVTVKNANQAFSIQPRPRMVTIETKEGEFTYIMDEDSVFSPCMVPLIVCEILLKVTETGKVLSHTWRLRVNPEVMHSQGPMEKFIRRNLIYAAYMHGIPTLLQNTNSMIRSTEDIQKKENVILGSEYEVGQDYVESIVLHNLNMICNSL